MVAGHRGGAKLTHEMGRHYGQTTPVETYTNQRLTPAEAGKAHGVRAKLSNRPWEILPLDYRWATANVAIVEMGSCLATEGMVTLHRSSGKCRTREKSPHGTSGEAMETSASFEARSASFPYLTGNQRQHRSVRGGYQPVPHCDRNNGYMLDCVRRRSLVMARSWCYGSQRNHLQGHS
jgi:hypothetical protein